jgi:hypothetical protein
MKNGRDFPARYTPTTPNPNTAITTSTPHHRQKLTNKRKN